MTKPKVLITGRERADRRADHPQPRRQLRVQRPEPPRRRGHPLHGRRRSPTSRPSAGPSAGQDMVLHLAGDDPQRRQLGRPLPDHRRRDDQRAARGGRGGRPAGRVHEHRQHDVRLGMGRRAALRRAGRAASGTWPTLGPARLPDAAAPGQPVRRGQAVRRGGRALVLRPDADERARHPARCGPQGEPARRSSATSRASSPRRTRSR